MCSTVSSLQSLALHSVNTNRRPSATTTNDEDGLLNANRRPLLCGHVLLIRLVVVVIVVVIVIIVVIVTVIAIVVVAVIVVIVIVSSPANVAFDKNNKTTSPFAAWQKRVSPQRERRGEELVWRSSTTSGTGKPSPHFSHALADIATKGRLFRRMDKKKKKEEAVVVGSLLVKWIE